jgi:catechol 2,3-dioxygenase-like lactoylglutathione lyase family enzyme
MKASLTYVINYVGDMDSAVAFYCDALGLTLKFQSPEWTEFATGSTTLALHAASAANPPGKVGVGFGVDDVSAFHAALKDKVRFTRPPKREHGVTLAAFIDADGAEVSVSGP